MKRSKQARGVVPGRLRWAVPAGAMILVWPLMILLSTRSGVDLVLVLLPLLLVAMLISAISGILPGVLTSIAFVLLINWYLIPPVHTLRIDSSESLVALLVFALGSLFAAISMNVVINAREQAALTSAQRRLIVDVVDELSPEDAIERLRGSLELDSVTMNRIDGSGAETCVLTCSGDASVGSGSQVFDVTVLDGYRIRGFGPARMALDTGFLDSLAVAVARAYEGQLLLEEQAHNARLVDLDRARSALLASVGHDLRTPLSAMLVASESLRIADSQLSSSDREQLLMTIDSAGRRLDSLIENLLDMSRIESGALIVVRKPEFVDAVIAQAIVEVGSNRVRLRAPDESVVVECDSALLGRAIVNVVSNAVIHDGSEREITVSLVEAGHVWEIRVSDHGQGIPVHEREFALRAFSQVGTRADGGAGAGLSIADAFMHAMGGSLVMSDTEGGGLTVTLCLPKVAKA